MFLHHFQYHGQIIPPFYKYTSPAVHNTDRIEYREFTDKADRTFHIVQIRKHIAQDIFCFWLLFQLFLNAVFYRAVCACREIINQHFMFILCQIWKYVRGKYLDRQCSAFFLKIGYFKLFALCRDIFPIERITLNLVVNIAIQERAYARTAAVIMLPFMGGHVDIKVLIG